ncbi:alpha/beta fold hydrolase [Gordonibacter urolithinfaciens]|uniref:Alpha/beta fold hydrolase n=1 Tax=Gordonibacter urolithinfaciens TaxID=1335613 RepID=A0A7K0IDP2_9ACTN|nr:alpha/beta fold hydrolase [Gordonibacter urolithinfaciens]
MKSLYKSAEGKRAVLDLYDEQLSRIGCPFEDVYVDTAFGRTHVVVTGDPEAVPLLSFHGGNSTTAHNLITSPLLLRGDFRVLAVDTIGHPGKSDETCLPPSGYAYGEWAAQVIDALGFARMRCIGGSFGAGILAKLMCAAPEKVERAVLFVPSGIKNAPAWHSMSMMGPMVMHLFTRREEWFVKTLLPMAGAPDVIDAETLATARATIDHAKVKAGMPTDVDPERMAACTAPTLVMASDADRLFPAARVLPQAEAIIPNVTCRLMRGRAHMGAFTAEQECEIVEFLKEGAR